MSRRGGRPPRGSQGGRAGHNQPARGHQQPRRGQHHQSHGQQRPQQGGSHATTHPTQLPSFCPFGECQSSLADVNAYKVHVRGSHANDFKDHKIYSDFLEIFVDYGIRYYHTDSSSYYERFAHACPLCRKHVMDQDTVENTENTLEEDIQHIEEHYSIPEYYCMRCSLSLVSKNAAVKHCNTTHSDRKMPDPTTVYLATKPESAANYVTLTTQLLAERQQAIEQARSMSREVVTDQDVVATNIDQDLEVALARNDADWKSLKDFKGQFAAVFRSGGTFNFLGQLILSSPQEEVDQCWQELNSDIITLEFLQHPRASCALASLVVRLNDEAFASFIRRANFYLLRVAQNEYTAHLFRRLLTSSSLQFERHQSLCEVLFVGNTIGKPVTESRFCGMFFSGIASRLGDHSSKLAEYFAENFVKVATNKNTNEACRVLAETASHNQTKKEYKSFFQTASNNIENIINSQYGCYVAQALIYYAPEFFAEFINKVTRADWIFGLNTSGAPNYSSSNHSHLIQTVLNRANTVHNNRLSGEINDRDLKDLLFSGPGNNIIREMAKNMDDIDMLKNLSLRLKAIVGNNHPLPKYVSVCISVVGERLDDVDEWNRNNLKR